jgi:hypothetical protein
MLTRIGLVASWENMVWTIHFSLCEVVPSEDHSHISDAASVMSV